MVMPAFLTGCPDTHGDRFICRYYYQELGGKLPTDEKKADPGIVRVKPEIAEKVWDAYAAIYKFASDQHPLNGHLFHALDQLNTELENIRGMTDEGEEARKSMPCPRMGRCRAKVCPLKGEKIPYILTMYDGTPCIRQNGGQ